MTKAFKFTLITAILLVSMHASSQNLSTVDNSLNAGKVEWLSRQIKVPNAAYGIPLVREFAFKNISEENLLLLEVKSSCHCTVVEYPHEAIAPGETASIKVTYDALKEGDFYRIVTVLTNFDTNQSVPIALTGKVIPKQQE